MEERIVKFIAALRNKGVRVSLAESEDAFSGVDILGVQNREVFKLTLRSTLIKDAKDLPTFDLLFPMFFESGALPPMESLPDDLTSEEAELIADALREFNQRLRRLLEKLLKGDPLTEKELAQLDQLVGLNHADDPSYQNWMQRRMEQALQFPKVKEAIEEMMAILSEMGMDPTRLEQMRTVLQDNYDRLREQIRRHVGEKIAENLAETRPEPDLDSLFNRPFSGLSDGDMDRLRSEVRKLASILRTRAALRQKRAKSGQLDAKATIRANLKHSGVPFHLKHKDRRLKPKFVVICDISTSMRSMSELMLTLVYSLQDQVTKTQAFAFIDHLEYISPDFSGQDAKSAVKQVLLRMPPGYYSTDMGYSLKNFHDNYMDMIDHRTTLIVVGDGRNNYNNPRLDIFSTLVRRSHLTIWLNPEPPYQWGTGDSDMLEYYPICHRVVQVSNLNELAAAVDQLLVS